MFLRNLLITWLTFLMIILTSCKKKEDVTSVNELLTNRSSKTWLLNSIIINGTEQLTLPCQKDDEWTFSNNKTLGKAPGFLRCDLYEQNTTVQYFLGGPNNESIYFTVADSLDRYDYNTRTDSVYHFTSIRKADIINLSTNTLQYKELVYDPDGSFITTTITSLTSK